MPAAGPTCYPYFWPTGYQTPFLGLINLLEWLTELRKTHLFTRLLICCCCSFTQSLFATPWTAACQASLSPTISQSLLKLMSFESVMPSNHLFSVVPFSSCPQSFLASGSFLMSQFFTSGGQSIGASASASVLPMHIQDWFPLGWTGLISLKKKKKIFGELLKTIF